MLVVAYILVGPPIATQVKGDAPHKKEYPDPPGLGLG